MLEDLATWSMGPWLVTRRWNALVEICRHTRPNRTNESYGEARPPSIVSRDLIKSGEEAYTKTKKTLLQLWPMSFPVVSRDRDKRASARDYITVLTVVNTSLVLPLAADATHGLGYAASCSSGRAAVHVRPAPPPPPPKTTTQMFERGLVAISRHCPSISLPGLDRDGAPSRILDR
ncbi:hypothetical protein CIB48_g7881 [Xylaria polymorpha]|nr:hypothetical protein CIB48_g7881 [Xylaria polymorpha]